MEKTVSIVIPVYNGEKYIEETIRGICCSTYQKIEIVIVDDGSSDASLQICKGLQEKDDRICVYNQKNSGVVAARNFGASVATGDFLCFCDQDDIVEDTMYEQMLRRIEEDKSDFCMCGTGRYINEKKIDYTRLQDACFESKEIVANILYPFVFGGYDVPLEMSDTRVYPSIWTCMFRMEFWKKHGFEFRAYVNFEDDLLVKLDAITSANKISTMSLVGYYWRANLKSETYAHKFVENIGEKQQWCFEDMRDSFRRVESNANVIQLFEAVTRCKFYLDAIHNLTSPYKKKTYSYIKEYYKNEIYQREFDEHIYAMKYVRKGQIKGAILLPILAKKWSILSYSLEIVLDYVLLFTLHFPLLIKLERVFKREREKNN